MPLVSSTLRSIVESISDTVYMRNTDVDSNIDIDLIDLENKTVVIYNNLPTIAHVLPTAGGTVTTRSWPMEMRILQLADMDDDGEGGDDIRERCLLVADTIFDKLLNNQLLSLTAAIEGYEVEFEDNVKVYDKVMTGCKLLINYPIDRESFNCT